MFKPVEMCKIHLLVLEKFVDAVTRTLGDSGFVHLVNAVPQSRNRLLQGVDRGADIRHFDALFQKCHDLMEGLGLPLPAAAPSRHMFSLEALEQLLQTVGSKFQAEEDVLGQLIENSGQLLQMASLLHGYPLQNVRFRELRSLSHLYLITGRLSPVGLPALHTRIGDRALIFSDPVIGKGDARLLLLSSRKNRFAIDAELTKAGFKEEVIPEELSESGTEERQHLEDRLDRVRRQIEERRRQVQQLAQRYSEPLSAAYLQLRETLAVVHAQQQFGRAAHLYCISGWIPKSREAETRLLATTATGGSAIVEVIAPNEDERVRCGLDQVPVKFLYNPFLKPFQLLISVYGIPRYQEVEPSFFVALSFLLIFGMMFGDVGQGSVLAVTGAALAFNHHPRIRPYRDIGFLLLFCGFSAVLFGFLYGSVFGAEHVLHHLWLQPLQDVVPLFKVSLGIGVVCISLAMFLNIINKWRSRDYFAGIFDKSGILGMLFYWGSIGLGLKATLAGRIQAWEIVLLLLLPLALIFLREPLHALLRRRKRLLEEDFFTFLMTSSMEVFETVTSFLANTVSFIRIGAFALSHAALCMTIYVIVDLLHDRPGGGFFGVLVIVFGNLFVIALEGMVAIIQGLRLQYYELFSKYFSGDGVLYKPFKLESSGNATTMED